MVGARLQGHVQRCAARAATGGRQRDALRVRAARAFVESLTHNRLAIDHHGADERIR